MVIYRTAQQQTNDIFTFAMSLLFMGLMFGLVKSLVAMSMKLRRHLLNCFPGLLKESDDKKVGFKSGRLQ